MGVGVGGMAKCLQWREGSSTRSGHESHKLSVRGKAGPRAWLIVCVCVCPFVVVSQQGDKRPGRVVHAAGVDCVCLCVPFCGGVAGR
jgi:hypothetical protein